MDSPHQAPLEQARPGEEGVLEAVPEAIVLVDERGRIALVNREAERLFGYGRVELLGKPVDLLFPEPSGGMASVGVGADVPRAHPHVTIGGLERLALRKDGTAFDVELTLGSVTTGPDTLTVSSIRDVTEQRKTEARLRAMLDAVPDALVIVDRTGRMVLVNSRLEQLFGYSRAELIGRPLDVLLPPRFHGVHRSHQERYFENRRPRPMGSGLDLRGQRKDGSEFHVEISLSPVETADVTLVSAAIRDVSERVRREERRRASSDRELEREAAAHSMAQEVNARLVLSTLREQELADAQRQASEIKSRFLASMSHEFRSPLSAISGFSDLIEDGIAGPVTVKQREYLRKIRAATGHLVRLIDDVLDLAKVEAGQMRVDRSPGSVKDAVDQALALMEVQAAAAGIALQVAAAPAADCWYLGDKDRVRQILLNLVSNAVKFTGAGGRVTLTFGETREPHPEAVLSGDGPWAFVAVEDTGIGIAPEDASAVFQPFNRVRKDPLPKRRPGTGLGLAISRELARRMQGDVTLRSVEGEGSCFTLWLPAGTAIAS